MKASILAAILMAASTAFAQKVEVVSGNAAIERTESRLVLSMDRDFDGEPDVVFELETAAAFEASGPAEIEFWQHGLSAYFVESQQLIFFEVQNADRPMLGGRRPHSTWEDVSFEGVTVRRFGGEWLTSRSGGAIETMGERRPTPQPTPWPSPGGGCGWSCSIGCGKGSCSVSCSTGMCASCECDYGGNPVCSCWPPQ